MFLNFYEDTGNMSELASRIKAIIENTVDGIITINEFGIIEFTNVATSKIFGFEIAEMIGQNISMLMPTPYSVAHDGYLNNYVTTGIKKIIGIGRELRGKCKDGSIFPMWLSVSEVVVENRRVFTGIVRDLTEQKKAEKSLLELNEQLKSKVEERTNKLSDVVNKLLATNQQLQHEIQERKVAEQAFQIVNDVLETTLKKEKDLSLLKSRFVSMASHEFRTPLSTILSSANLSVKYSLSEQQDKREKHFQKIKSAVTLLTTILDDFLSVSRLEEGLVEVSYENIDINLFFNELAEELNHSLKKGQKIVLKIEPLDNLVKMDKKLLRMIITNLISNASKYSDEAIPIVCEVKKEAKKYRIDIIDHGYGIPTEEKKHLFERFFRASNVAHIKGTGLGLHIVKHYVELLNGTIEFKSDLDKGSVFTIFFNL